MDLPKRKVLIKAFITSLFSYCPLIWMLHSRTLNNRTSSIHERALRLPYKDNQSSFKKLLENVNSVTVHHKNLQVLVTEIFKVKNDLAPDIVKDAFRFKGTSTSYGQNHVTLHAEVLSLLRSLINLAPSSTNMGTCSTER